MFERDRYVSLDYQTQEATRYRLVPGDAPGPLPVNIRRDDLDFDKSEPLRRELEDFVEAASTGRKPRVGARDGERALDLALQVVRSMAET